MKMRSGEGEKDDERDSCTNELIGGNDAKRFHVTATIDMFSCGYMPPELSSASIKITILIRHINLKRHQKESRKCLNFIA